MVTRQTGETLEPNLTRTRYLLTSPMLGLDVATRLFTCACMRTSQSISRRLTRKTESDSHVRDGSTFCARFSDTFADACQTSN